MGMKPKYLILGVPPGGLFLARQLRKQWPESVIYAIGDAKHDIGRFSNAIDSFYGISASDDVFPTVKLAYDALGQGDIRAFMCSNPMLECIVGQHPEVFDMLGFENNFEFYQNLIDKNKTDRLCSELNINTPQNYNLSENILSTINYPVVVKPLEKGLAIGASKCAYIADENQLKRYLAKMDSLGIDRRNLVCQQCVVGDNRWEYGYGGYFVRGLPLVDICFYQFIQVPQGLCCYSREVADRALERQIKDLVEPFFKKTEYTGFIEFDIKQDSNNRELFLLDINPRPWRSVDILKAKLGDSTVFNPKVSERKAVWRYPYRELFRRKNINNVPYGICRSLTKGYKTITQIALCDHNDPKPFRMQRKADFQDFVHKLKR